MKHLVFPHFSSHLKTGTFRFIIVSNDNEDLRLIFEEEKLYQIEVLNSYMKEKDLTSISLYGNGSMTIWYANGVYYICFYKSNKSFFVEEPIDFGSISKEQLVDLVNEHIRDWRPILIFEEQAFANKTKSTEFKLDPAEKIS